MEPQGDWDFLENYVATWQRLLFGLRNLGLLLDLLSCHTHRLLSSSSSGLPYRILNMNHKETMGDGINP